LETRNTDLHEAVSKMKTLASELYIEQIITTNPQAILDNKLLNVVVPKSMILPKQKTKGFWGKFW